MSLGKGTKKIAANNGEMVIVTFPGVVAADQLTLALLLREGKVHPDWVGERSKDALRFSVLTVVRPIVEIDPPEDCPGLREDDVRKGLFQSSLKI